MKSNLIICNPDPEEPSDCYWFFCFSALSRLKHMVKYADRRTTSEPRQDDKFWSHRKKLFAFLRVPPRPLWWKNRSLVWGLILTKTVFLPVRYLPGKLKDFALGHLVTGDSWPRAVLKPERSKVSSLLHSSAISAVKNLWVGFALSVDRSRLWPFDSRFTIHDSRFTVYGS